jgi:LUD domain
MDYTKLASKESLNRTIESLKANGFQPIVLKNKEEALTKVKEMIPIGASIMDGSSRTLEEIGFIDYLKEGTHEWNNLHEVILAEKDPARQAELRHVSLASDYYLGSVHALAETGEMVVASGTGSQLPHLVFTSKNVILVVGTQKIVPTLTDARERLLAHVLPLEDARMKSIGYGGATLAKELILYKEHAMMGRTITVLLVEEKLGY